MVDAAATATPTLARQDAPPHDEASSPAKKRRGRPRKSEAADATATAATGDASKKQAIRSRKAVSEVYSYPLADASLVGQQVHGFLDASFDAGYVLTVRVGDSDTMLRGVIFRQGGVALPITNANDIAPQVKFTQFPVAEDITTTTTTTTTTTATTATPTPPPPDNRADILPTASSPVLELRVADSADQHDQQQQQGQQQKQQQQQMQALASVFGIQSASGASEQPPSLAANLRLSNGILPLQVRHPDDTSREDAAGR